jgi:phosphatidylserine synthase
MWHQLSGGVAAFLPVMAIVLGGLMVATFRYPDLPKHYLRSRHPGKHLALLALLAIVVLPPVSLPVLLLAYTLFVPVAAIWQRVADQLANGAR